MADERRRTALTAMESFVESSFKPRQYHQHHQQQRLQRSLPPSVRHDVSHLSTNRKRRRHLGAEMTSPPGDEDGGEKRKRTDVGNVKDRSVSPRDDDATPNCDDDVAEKRSPMTSLSKPEVNGDGGGYLSCTTQDATKEHPLISLEKFVGVSAPLFRSPADISDAAGLNGISSPVCRTPGMPDGKPLTVDDDDDGKMTSFGGDSASEAAATSRSMRNVNATSGSLGRSFASAQSLLCCNL